MASNLTGPDGGLTDEAWDRIEATPNARTHSKTTRQIRKRVGRERFPTYARIMVEVATGTFQGYDRDALTQSTKEEATIVERGMGVERARVDRVAGAEPLLGAEDLEPMLRTLSEVMRPSALRDALAEAGARELDEAREQVRFLFPAISGFGSSAAALMGQGAFGLTAFSRIWETATPEDQAMFLLMWLSFRRREDAQQGYEAFAAGLNPRALEEGRTSAHALQLLRDNVPAFADVLSPREMRAALRNPKRMEASQARARVVFLEHRTEVAALAERFPELLRYFPPEVTGIT